MIHPTSMSPFRFRSWTRLYFFLTLSRVQGWTARTPSRLPPSPLTDLATQLAATQWNFQIAVGSQQAPLPIQNIHVELTDMLGVANKADSTGIHQAKLLGPPTYIDRQGQHAVTWNKGGWEVVWNQNSPHGHLTCSFVNAAMVQRNQEASLEAGRLFVCHRVWTAETLESERQRRRNVQSQAALHLDERDRNIQKITEDQGSSSSVGDKVISYAQAARSVHKFRNLGYEETLFIPLYDEQVLQLSPTCILSTRGLVYKVNPKGRLEKIGESRVDFLNNRDEK